MLNTTPLLHQSFGPRVLLSLSLSLYLFFRLIPWSTEALWVHFLAQASKTLLRRCSAPSPHREGAWGLHEQSKPRAGALLAFCVNQGISASFSPLLSYHRHQTTKFRPLKDLNTNGCWQFDLWFLPFLNPVCLSGSSWFMYCWNLAWRILNIGNFTLLACEMGTIVW